MAYFFTDTRSRTKIFEKNLWANCKVVCYETWYDMLQNTCQNIYGMCSEVKIASHVLSNLCLVFIKPKFFSQKYFCLLPCKDWKQRCYWRHGLRVFLDFETLWLNNHQRELHQWSPPTSQFINSSQFGKNVISFQIIRYPDISQKQFNGLTYDHSV